MGCDPETGSDGLSTFNSPTAGKMGEWWNAMAAAVRANAARHTDDCLVHYSGVVTDDDVEVKIVGTSGLIQGRALVANDRILIPKGRTENSGAASGSPATLDYSYTLGGTLSNGQLISEEVVGNANEDLQVSLDSTPAGAFNADTVHGQTATKSNSTTGTTSSNPLNNIVDVNGASVPVAVMNNTDAAMAFNFRLDEAPSATVGYCTLMTTAETGGNTVNSLTVRVTDEGDLSVQMAGSTAITYPLVIGQDYRIMIIRDSTTNLSVWLNGALAGTVADAANITHDYLQFGYDENEAGGTRFGKQFVGAFGGKIKFWSGGTWDEDAVIDEYVGEVGTPLTDHTYDGIWQVVTPNDSGDTVISRAPDADAVGDLAAPAEIFVWSDRSTWRQMEEGSLDPDSDEYNILENPSRVGKSQLLLCKETTISTTDAALLVQDPFGLGVTGAVREVDVSGDTAFQIDLVFPAGNWEYDLLNVCATNIAGFSSNSIKALDGSMFGVGQAWDDGIQGGLNAHDEDTVYAHNPPTTHQIHRFEGKGIKEGSGTVTLQSVQYNPKPIDVFAVIRVRKLPD